MDVKELLKKGYIVLDGAMGTMLQKKGMKMGVVPETLVSFIGNFILRKIFGTIFSPMKLWLWNCLLYTSIILTYLSA